MTFILVRHCHQKSPHQKNPNMIHLDGIRGLSVNVCNVAVNLLHQAGLCGIVVDVKNGWKTTMVVLPFIRLYFLIVDIYRLSIMGVLNDIFLAVMKQ